MRNEIFMEIKVPLQKIINLNEYLLQFRFGHCTLSTFRARSIDKKNSKSEILEDRLRQK